MSWWVAIAPAAEGEENKLGPFCSEELAIKVRSYMELASREHEGRMFWVYEDD